MVQDALAQDDPLRGDIIAFIEERLGTDLTKLYGDAIRSSVSTGCYDMDWQGDREKIEQYLKVLHKDWLGKHDNQDDLLFRVLCLLDFGNDQDKAQLRELLQLP